MSIRVALAAGTVLSLGAAAAIASQDPGPGPVLHLSARHPLGAYLALAGAAPGNGWELFALITLIFSVCIVVAGLRQERRRGRSPE
jgi:hypothetical protein